MTILASVLAIAFPPLEKALTVPHRGHRCDKTCKKIRYEQKIVAPYDSKLNRMASCESTSRWWLNTGNGFYGGLQFTPSTWWSVGGRGYPNASSELEQKYRAVLVHNRRGSWGDWPVCGTV